MRILNTRYHSSHCSGHPTLLTAGTNPQGKVKCSLPSPQATTRPWGLGGCRVKAPYLNTLQTSSLLALATSVWGQEDRSNQPTSQESTWRQLLTLKLPSPSLAALVSRAFSITSWSLFPRVPMALFSQHPRCISLQGINTVNHRGSH